MTWHDYASIISIVVAGIADGFATTKRDGISGIVEKRFADNIKFIDWWIGGNVKYNPSNPFTADYWHFLKFIIIYSYCSAVAFQVWARYGVWFGIGSFLVLQAIEGTVFRLFYGYVCRVEPIGTFTDFIKACNPFINNRKN